MTIEQFGTSSKMPTTLQNVLAQRVSNGVCGIRPKQSVTTNSDLETKLRILAAGDVLDGLLKNEVGTHLLQHGLGEFIQRMSVFAQAWYLT